MPIDNAVLLQMDVTAIFGISIFLTVHQHIVGRKVETSEIERETWVVMVSTILIPFAASAMIILIGSISSTEVFALTIASILAIIGFIILLLFFISLYRRQW